jgi:hypothetical protein
MKSKLSDSGIRLKVNSPNVLNNYTKYKKNRLKRKSSRKLKKKLKKKKKTKRRVIITDKKNPDDILLERGDIKKNIDLDNLKVNKKHVMNIKTITIENENSKDKLGIKNNNNKLLILDPGLLDKVDKKKKGQKFSF